LACGAALALGSPAKADDPEECMAEIRIERKGRGLGLLWLFLALVIVAVLAWYFLYPGRTTPAPAPAAPTTGMLEGSRLATDGSVILGRGLSIEDQNPVRPSTRGTQAHPQVVIVDPESSIIRAGSPHNAAPGGRHGEQG
jgi:hypothetical protein